MADDILTGEAARLFLAEKGALSPCSACGGASFELQDESILGEVYALPSFPPKDGDVGGTQVAVAWCKDCGCIRLTGEGQLKIGWHSEQTAREQGC